MDIDVRNIREKFRKLWPRISQMRNIFVTASRNLNTTTVALRKMKWNENEPLNNWEIHLEASELATWAAGVVSMFQFHSFCRPKRCPVRLKCKCHGRFCSLCFVWLTRGWIIDGLRTSIGPDLRRRRRRPKKRKVSSSWMIEALTKADNLTKRHVTTICSTLSPPPTPPQTLCSVIPREILEQK